MKPIHGKILMATGVIHCAVAAPTIYGESWRQFMEKGLFNVSPHTWTNNFTISFSDITAEAAVWFFVGGVLFSIIGQLMHILESKVAKPPTFVGWELLAIGVVFAWMLPKSGFTFLVIPQAIYLLIRARRAAPRPE